MVPQAKGGAGHQVLCTKSNATELLVVMMKVSDQPMLERLAGQGKQGEISISVSTEVERKTPLCINMH